MLAFRDWLILLGALCVASSWITVGMVGGTHFVHDSTDIEPASEQSGTGGTSITSARTGLSWGNEESFDIQQSREITICQGTIRRPAPARTVVSIQGARGRTKTAPRLIGVRGDGTPGWVHQYSGEIVWSYDVDPLPNGNLFVTTTVRENGDGDTIVFEFNPRAGERVWQQRFDALDTHDADLIDNGRAIVVANMRNTGDNESGDRIFVYNRSKEAVTWQWRFESHGFSPDKGGEYDHDWTHVNDVDSVGENHFLVSVRNFDQVLLINRTSKEIELQLGAEGDFEILREQHNSDYLQGKDGTPTILIADSENDRIVEYAHRNGEWVRTWELTGDLDWPRDADRLPNGNTLITDSRNHRVIEVAPNGTIVWETYTPWLPYESERRGTGDESSGPTIAQQNASGNYELTGSAGAHDNQSRLENCAEQLRTTDRQTATSFPSGTKPTPSGSEEWAYGTSFQKDEQTDGTNLLIVGTGIAFVLALVGGLLARRVG